jgi:hypothetical protein
MMLHAVTCIFNPCGYQSRMDNYWLFREELGCPLTTVELSFNGRFTIPDAIHVTGSATNIMWQKERLLNLAIESLPAEVDKVAWIDADILFTHDEWIAETERQLNHYAVVQLFDTICFLDSKRRIQSGTRGLAYGLAGMPGAAFAARRELLLHGLYDRAILGGADRLMTLAWSGAWSAQHFAYYPKPLVSDFWQWARKQRTLADGRIGTVPGVVWHLYHGSKQNRRNAERLRWLRDFGFDPRLDISLDENDIWTWSSDKLAFHQLVFDYFAGRREDE